jgi:hypothetical protein
VRTIWYALAYAFVVFLSAAGCHRDRCVPTCEQRAKELNCIPRECKTKCAELHAPPFCAKEMKRFESCFLAEPTKNWICDEEGLPVVRQEVCAKERQAVIACLQSAPSRPPPPH